MSHDNSSFHHHLDKVSGAQFETQIPPYKKHNDFLIEMSSFEKITSGRGIIISPLSQCADPYHRLHQNQLLP
jgi:hypothetical protein